MLDAFARAMTEWSVTSAIQPLNDIGSSVGFVRKEKIFHKWCVRQSFHFFIKSDRLRPNPEEEGPELFF